MTNPGPLLRRDFEHSVKRAAAEVRVVLVRHDDLQLVFARLLDLIGQSLVAEAVLVEVEQHVGRGGRPSIGGGDRETGNGVGNLFSQDLCARVGRRGPEHGLLGKGEQLALGLARHAEREGGLVQVVGRAEEHRLWFKGAGEKVSGGGERTAAGSVSRCASTMVLSETRWNSSIRM